MPSGGGLPAFALWHAAMFAHDGSASFKAYLNPYAHGRERAADLVQRALERLGLERAWHAVARLAERGPGLDELRFFSIDLGDAEDARVKVYVSKHRTDVASLYRAAELARHSDPDAMRLFFQALAKGDEGFLPAHLPAVACYDFVGDDPTPQHLTVHFPVRAYAPNDADAFERIGAVLRSFGREHDALSDAAPRFERIVEAFAERDLAAGSGLFSYASFRAEAACPKLTVYLATEQRAVGETHPEVRLVSAPSIPVEPVLQVIRRHEDEPITWHPFLQRLAREPLVMQRLALVLHNFREAITRDFARRLASVVARVEEDEMRCILTKQLNDELGDGDYSRAHRELFERFVDGMSEYWSDELEAKGARGRT